MKKLKSNKGFTLIEILIVIGIIAILATIVIVAINPAKQFAQARNTQRESGVNTILNAVGQNIADYKGLFTCASIVTAIPVVGPPMVPASGLNIEGQAGAGLINLSCLVPTYISTALPTDPGSAGTPVVPAGTIADTQYTIQVDSVGRYTICAPGHQENPIPGSATYCLTR